jgi:hypothetical protein
MLEFQRTAFEAPALDVAFQDHGGIRDQRQEERCKPCGDGAEHHENMQWGPVLVR